MSHEVSLADVEAAKKAQEELCERSGIPHFAPRDGVCWSCHRQIFGEEDGRSLITGCPFCHRSYVD